MPSQKQMLPPQKDYFRKSKNGEQKHHPKLAWESSPGPNVYDSIRAVLIKFPK